MTKLSTHAVFFFALLILSFNAYASVSLETSAKQAIVVDFDTGAVLYAKNADERMPTSSMSKVMTIYEVFKALDNDEIKLNTELTVSEKAWRKGGSKMFVEVGKDVRVEDLIRGVIVQSGNDATIVLAEGLSGSEDAFANRINRSAKELGMSESNFTNASGWPDENHYSTARDLAKLGVAIIRDFPERYPYYAEQEFTFNEIKQANRNPLLYRGLGADGIKTGHTEVGGYGLIGSGRRNGRRVVFVINGLADEQARAQESAKFLEWGLSQYKNKTLHKAGEVMGQAAVDFGKLKVVDAVLDTDVFLTLPVDETIKSGLSVEYDQSIIAPVTKGQKIGVFSVSVPGQDKKSFPLYAGADVEAVGAVSKAFIKAKRFIGGFVAGKAQGIADKTKYQLSVDKVE